MSIISTVPKGAAVEGINPNLLDNWYFVGGGTGFPVNQRGLTQYSGNVTAFDRWRIENQYGQSIELTSDGVKITGTSSVYNGIVQIFENPMLFNGKTLTISCLFTDGTFLFNSGVCLLGSSNAVIFGAGSQLDGRSYLFLFGSTSNLSLHIRCNTNLTKTVVAAKVELGTEQTLAHQENGTWVLNEIPDYGEELRKCQRYFLRIGKFSSSSNAMPIGSLTTAGATNAADYVVSLPTTMRNSTPSLTYSGTIMIYKADGSSSVTVSNLSLNTAYCSNISLHMTATFSPTVTKGTLMGSMILSESSYVDISCEP